MGYNQNKVAINNVRITKSGVSVLFLCNFEVGSLLGTLE